MTKLALSTFDAPAIVEALTTEGVFSALTRQLGGKMADLFCGHDLVLVQQEWDQALAGFSQRELNRGLTACRGRTFAPTLGEFSTLCRPSLDPEMAWYEAQDGLKAREQGRMGAWTHPGVWRAACELSHEIRSNQWAGSKKRWARILSRELSRGMGEGVPPPAPRIEYSPQVVAIPADLRKQLAELRNRICAKGQS